LRKAGALRLDLVGTYGVFVWSLCAFHEVRVIVGPVSVDRSTGPGSARRTRPASRPSASGSRATGREAVRSSCSP